MTEEENLYQQQLHQQQEEWQQQMEADRKEILVMEIKSKLDELERLIAA